MITICFGTAAVGHIADDADVGCALPVLSDGELKADSDYPVRVGGSANPIFLRRLGEGFISFLITLMIS